MIFHSPANGFHMMSTEVVASVAAADAAARPAAGGDAEAEHFVDTADLTEYDLSGFKPMRFEFEKKDAQLNRRVPETLLEAVKSRAKQRGIPFTGYIRTQNIATSAPTTRGRSTGRTGG
jgi:predicted DNA binding CopG/RHH family protein